jgi:hypothetical protein
MISKQDWKVRKEEV